MSRVALVIGQLGIGGAEKQLCQLAAGLARRGYRPLVISLSAAGGRAERLRAAGVETVSIARNGSFDLKRLRRVAEILRSHAPDIVHGFDHTGSIYGRVAGAALGVPILIGGVRSAVPPVRRVLLIERLLRRRTDAVVSNSSAGKRNWARLAGYPEEKIVVIPNGFDFEEMGEASTDPPAIHELLGLPACEPLIGSIGSVYELKNPLMFIEVAAAVNESAPRTHFVWVGDGPMRLEMERVVKRRGLSEVVHFIGGRGDAAWLARDFRLGMLTSKEEGMPNAIMEYMYWGLPVVATDAGGCRELVEHGRTGFIVARDDVAAMTAYAKRLLDDRAAAGEMGGRGRARLRDEFSVETLVNRTVALYEELRAKKRLGSTVGRSMRHAL